MAKRRVVILLQQQGDERSPKTKWARSAALAYAEARGFNGLEVETITVQGPLLAVDGFATVTPGNVVITPSLDHLASTAAQLRDGLPKVLGRGIELHVASLGGPVTDSLHALQAGLALAEPLEAEIARLREANADAEQRWREMFETWRRDFSSAMVKRWGVPSAGISAADLSFPPAVEAMVYKPKAAANGHDEAPADLRPVGQYIRALREKISWPQQMLADALSVSTSQISRLESTGSSPHLLKALQVLGAPSDFMETFEAMSPHGRAQLCHIQLSAMAEDKAGAPIWLGPDGSQGAVSNPE